MKKDFKISAGMLFLLAFMILGFGELAFAGDGVSRSLLKAGSALAAILGVIGIAVAGYFAGKSYDTYTGWERYHHGAGQFYNRKPFLQDRPTYGVMEATQRLTWIESLIGRMSTIKDLVHPPGGGEPKWVPPMGVDALPDPLRRFFKENEEKYKHTLNAFKLIDQQKANWEHFKVQLALADAWTNAHAATFEDHEGEIYFDRLFPPEPKGPPGEWDFRGIRRDQPLPFKSPKHASRLIKRIAHTFGATLVGITKLNPDWCYQGHLRGVGPGKWEVPAHWEYAIVVVTPHEWDSMYCNPTYGTSYDAYSRERIIAGKLEAFIHELGYPARSHVPPFFYDMVMPPVAIDAGLGEEGRHGLLISPELGANSRLACVTTNIPMEVDKPVNLGIMDFCKKCKICAEKCPSGAISHKDEMETVRGYHRWRIRDELCFQVWASVAQSHVRGCRICLAVCPYSRKNNWVHAVSRYVDPRDPTGIVASLLLWAQKSFFKYPEAKDFMPPPTGKNATYHEPPDWLQTDKWFDVPRTW
ncbi:MAG: 4Fe-4S dicluster domain-containing protein [Deltaproteobacteria bacterium]|nr:4Fe-4S dicluster domain-containing protein [Deltaproteobacteria bacterium]